MNSHDSATHYNNVLFIISDITMVLFNSGTDMI